jgi:hypothetical protein
MERSRALFRRIHRLPDGEHIGMLMRELEAVLYPGEDLDVRRAAAVGATWSM